MSRQLTQQLKLAQYNALTNGSNSLVESSVDKADEDIKHRRLRRRKLFVLYLGRFTGIIPTPFDAKRMAKWPHRLHLNADPAEISFRRQSTGNRRKPLSSARL